jgi:hypothetical protein
VLEIRVVEALASGERHGEGVCLGRGVVTGVRLSETARCRRASHTGATGMD